MPATGDDQLGGTTYFNASAEAQFPLPVVPESFGLRGAVFADAATLYGNKIRACPASTSSATGMEWRASVGAGLIWASPFGPLRVDYAVPVMKEDDRRGAGLQLRHLDPLLSASRGSMLPGRSGPEGNEPTGHVE